MRTRELVALLAVLLAGCPGPKQAKKSARVVHMPVFTAEELAKAEPLRVVSAVPEGEAEGVSETDEIAVTFDAVMVALEEIPDTNFFPLLLEPDVPGSCHWLGNRTIVFRPDTLLPVATEFKVTIPKGVKALEGAMLKEDYTFTFSTVRPELEYSSPQQGEEFVRLDQPMYLKFNVAMDPKRARGSIRLLRSDGTADPFRIRMLSPKDKVRERWWFDVDDSARILVLVPARQLAIQTEYELVLEEGLLAREGNLGTGEQGKVEFRTFNRFAFQGLSGEGKLYPEDPLSLEFSNPVPYSGFAQHVRFKPDVKLDRRYEDYGYSSQAPDLWVPLRAETTYEMTLSKWLKDDFGNRLGRDVRVRFATGSFRPYFTMPTGRGIVEAGIDLKQPVTMVNIESLDVRMKRVSRDQVIPFWRSRYDDWDDEDLAWTGGFDFTKTWYPKQKRNQRVTLPLRLEQGLGSRKAGYLFCELDCGFEPERGLRYRRSFLQVTPYGLTAKFSPENGLGVVTTLADAKPVAGIPVQLRDDANRVIWSGRTAQDGAVLFPGWSALGLRAEDEWSTPRVWLFAGDETAEGFVHSGWGTGIYPYELGVSYDWYPKPNRPEAFIFTEKGVYKAADTVRVKGMARQRKLGRWVVPATRTGQLRVTDSRDEEVLSRSVNLSGEGSFDLVIPLSADAVSGYYSMTFDLADETFYSSFRVEAYRPVEFEVTVKGDKESYLAGDAFKATIDARYLFGAAMAGDSVNWSIALSPTWFAPPGHDGFHWGVSEEEFSYGSKTVGSGKGRLDDAGRTEAKARLDLGRSLSPQTVTCEATVTSKNSRTVTGRESYVVHRSSTYIGVKQDEEFAEVGDSLGFDLITVTPEGKMAPGSTVSVTFFRRVWHSARKAQTGGRYSWVSEKQDIKVRTVKVKTGAEPVRRYFKPDKPGYYWAKCETRDRKRNPTRTDFSFWVAGPGEAAWMMRDDDLVELVRDKGMYRPGDTARILVKSPWTNINALVTIEREHVIDHFETRIEGNASVVRVPVKEEYLPNVYVSVVILKGRTAQNQFDEQGSDLGKPGFKLGYVELPVNPDAKKLEVKVSTQEEYRPGQEVELTVKVSDKAGAGRAAELTLAVVDLGVLKLTGYSTPDPFSVFFASRALSVVTAESRLHVIGQRNYGEKGEAAAGDGWGEKAAGDISTRDGAEYEFAYRQKFLETALWLPVVRSDANGNAKVRFRLPDNLTTWQVMAVAASGEFFGSGDAKFKSNKPLLIQPSLPRFVRPNDEFSSGVMVHNRTKGLLNVAVTASAGAGLKLVGDAKREVKVEPDKAQEVLFKYHCTGGDKAEFTFEARSGQETDGLAMSLPVRNPHISEAVAVYEQTLDSLTSQFVTVPTDVFSGVGGLELTASSSGLAGLERGLEFLRTYPYECLEQRLSKVLPFVVGETVINQFQLSDLRGAELRQFVQGVLRVVPGFQDGSGGFHFWTGPWTYDKPSPYLSAYCMYALAMCRRNGYEVDRSTVEQGKSYLMNWLNYGAQNRDWPYSVDEQLTTRALAVYALGLWGEQIDSYLNPLSERIDQMSVFGKAYLLKASSLMPKSANTGELEDRLIRAMNNKLKLEPTLAHYEEAAEGGWTFHSNVRTTACVLQALLEARGEVEFAEKAVKWLVTERKAGRWRTTQENAYVFDAFCTFYRVYEKTRPDFTVTMRLEGRELLRRAFSGRSLETAREFVPLDKLTGTGQQRLAISKSGPGRLYYGLRLSYAPKGETRPKEEGLRIEKSIKPVSGRGAGYVRGQNYLVTIKVHTAQERLFVVVDDPLPAGFEVVNTSFATESQANAQALELARDKTDIWQWWGEFDHEEIYDDRYVLFATSLSRGTHVQTYMVKALTPGRFFMPASKAEEMYMPEVFGNTGQMWVEVR